jgi:hypothetical protein
MNTTGEDRAKISAAVPELESTSFRIHAGGEALPGEWLASPFRSEQSTELKAEDFRVSLTAVAEQFAEQQKKTAQAQNVRQFELKRKNELICFAGHEISLQCAAADRDARLALLRDFCRLYAGCEKLESRAAQLLKEARQDTCYSGKVSPKWLGEFDRLGEQKRAAALLRIDFAELKRLMSAAAEKAPDGKLFEDLLEASGLEERLELTDEEIEIVEDIYGECVEKLSDFDYFWREYWAELWIIVILIVELLEFGWEIVAQVPKT